MPVFTAFKPANFLKPLALSLPVALACTTSSLALTPQEAWVSVSSFVTGTGAQLRVGTTATEGADFVVRDVTVTMSRRGNAPRLNIPELRLSPEGESVRLTPSANFTLAGVSTESPAGTVERDFAFSHNGSLLLGLSDAALQLGLDFPSFSVSQTGAKSPQGSLNERYQISLTALTGQMGLPLVAPFGITAQLAASLFEQSVDAGVSDQPFAYHQTGTASSRDLRVSITGRNFPDPASGVTRASDVLRAGLEIGAELTTGPSVTNMTITLPDMPPVQLQLNQIDSQFTGRLANGALRMEGSAGRLDGTIGFGGVSGPVSLERTHFFGGMPLIVTPDEREFSLGFTLQNLSISEQLVQAFGFGPLARTPVNIELDLGARGRLTSEIVDGTDPASNPFELSQASLGRLLLGFGGAELSGSGRFDFAPGSFARIENGPPDGRGSFTFDLRGANALLAQLVQLGLVPADQQFAAQMGINMFGRPVGEDHVRSEIVINPGPQITINGAPLPF